MSYYVPDLPINPPEDTRGVVYECALCEGSIREGDEYYDIPTLGVCCADCIEDARHYEAELDNGADEMYERMREENYL